MQNHDLVIHNAHLATMDDDDASYGIIHDGLVAVRAGLVDWVGPERDAPPEWLERAGEVCNAGGGWVSPGLIDSHTHLVFGGTRAIEFEARLRGQSYEDIARAGGGILSTVRATREASEADLMGSGARRLATLADHGVTTVEIKSGYGLDVTTELRMLSVARALGEDLGVEVSGTLLGLHALPPEYAGDRGSFVALVRDELLPRAASHGLARQVDAFCEGIAFTPDECRTVLTAGAALGLGVRLHADQLSDLGGAALAADLGATSADHLEWTSPEGAEAMARAGTAAVLLPGAYHYLGGERRPPVTTLRALGVPMVVATDLNPGSSPVASPLVAMNLACVHFGLTPEEALLGMTRHAAPVLGLEDRGRIAAGLRADLAVWDVSHPSELSYWLGANPLRATVRAGELRSRA